MMSISFLEVLDKQTKAFNYQNIEDHLKNFIRRYNLEISVV